MSGSEGARFDPKKAAEVSDACWTARKKVTAEREKIANYYNHVADLWVGNAATAYRWLMVDAIKALDKVDQHYWDLLTKLNEDAEKMKAADEKADQVAASIEPAVWADIDSGTA